MKDFRKNSIIELGKRLKQMRIEKDLSLNIFAYENDLKLATVSRVENGLVVPKYSTLMKYAIALEVTLQELLGEINFIEEIDE